MNTDTIYIDMLASIIKDGDVIRSRNSVTRRLTNMQATFFSTPLVSIRRTAWKSALLEMEWFLSGSSNIGDLHPSVHKWWEPWADKNSGEIKNNYSKQFRRFNGEFDQLKYFLDAIKNHPFSRRSIMTTWNAQEMAHADTPITNCHGTVVQAFVSPNNELDILMYQRSSDMLLGMPHNWIQYWAFLLYAAKYADKIPRKLSWIGGDCHIYQEHIPVVEAMHSAIVGIEIRTPTLVYTGSAQDSFKADDFKLEGTYAPILTISPKMVV